MQITRENTSETTATIKMVVQSADYTDAVNKILKDYQRKATVPGFRPGHVPFGMIKKLYGTAVFADEVNKLVSDKLHDYIVDEKIEILGQPIPNTTITPESDWKEGMDLDFGFDIALTPKFDVVLDDSIEVDYHVIKVDDEMIDKYVADMRQRFGSVQAAELSGEKDVLVGDFVELDAEANPKEGGISNSSRVAVDMIKDAEISTKFVGKKVSDDIIFNPLKATGNASETAAMLNIDKTIAENLQSDFRFTITEITTVIPAEMNEEFYEKVFPGQEVKDETTFRNKVREESERAFVADSDHLFSHHAQEKLVETFAFSLPDEFMKRWLVESNEGRLTAEDVETNYSNYVLGMKWQLIENKIIRDAEINVEDSEIKDYIKDYYLQGWRSMELNQDLAKRLDEIADSFIKDKPKEVRRIVDALYGQRVMSHVKSKVKLVEKHISYDEFVKMDALKH